MPIGQLTYLILLSASCSGHPCRDDCLDDPAHWNSEGNFSPLVGEPNFVVPRLMPPEIECQAANNNVDIIFHQGRLYLAFRTAPNHFASPLAQMCVVSSPDLGKSWKKEVCYSLETDVREPRLMSFLGSLQLIFFEAGTNPLAFEPRNLRRAFQLEPGRWTSPEVFYLEGEKRPVVPWDVKVRYGRAWMTAYAGEHYGGEPGQLDVLFYSSDDGITWLPAAESPVVYHGGVSEVAFEFDSAGNLWAIGRNEDGDATGFGSQVFYAPAGNLGGWQSLAQSDPERYDSPELFRHDEDIFLSARRDVRGPFGPEGDLVAYSFRPKRSALYRLNRAQRRVEFVQDLPGVGDTAFFAVRRSAEHSFLLANYTSPLDNPDISWLEGQTSDRGTSIYLLPIEFTTE